MEYLLLSTPTPNPPTAVLNSRMDPGSSNIFPPEQYDSLTVNKASGNQDNTTKIIKMWKDIVSNYIISC